MAGNNQMIKESKYESRFSKVVKEAPESFSIMGNRLLIEVLTDPNAEIKSKGGIILGAPLSDHAKSEFNMLRSTLGIVLLVGEGYYDETTGEDIPLSVGRGSIVLVSELGIKHYSTFPGLNEYIPKSLGMISEADIQMSFPTIEAYNEFSKILSK